MSKKTLGPLQITAVTLAGGATFAAIFFALTIKEGSFTMGIPEGRGMDFIYTLLLMTGTAGLAYLSVLLFRAIEKAQNVEPYLERIAALEAQLGLDPSTPAQRPAVSSSTPHTVTAPPRAERPAATPSPRAEPTAEPESRQKDSRDNGGRNPRRRRNRDDQSQEESASAADEPKKELVSA